MKAVVARCAHAIILLAGLASRAHAQDAPPPAHLGYGPDNVEETADRGQPFARTQNGALYANLGHRLQVAGALG